MENLLHDAFLYGREHPDAHAYDFLLQYEPFLKLPRYITKLAAINDVADLYGDNKEETISRLTKAIAINYIAEGNKLIKVSCYTKFFETPKGIEVIGRYAFHRSCNLRKVIVNEGVKEIESAAFKLCFYLRDVSLPDSLEKIGRLAFCRCRSLKTIMLPKNLKIIGMNAFEACASLEHIEFPEGLEEIGTAAFNACSLKKVVIPNSLKVIGSRCFDEEVKVYNRNGKLLDYDRYSVTYLDRGEVKPETKEKKPAL